MIVNIHICSFFVFLLSLITGLFGKGYVKKPEYIRVCTLIYSGFFFRRNPNLWLGFFT